MDYIQLDYIDDNFYEWTLSGSQTYIYAHKYELHKKIALHCFLFTQEINNSENLIFTLLILNWFRYKLSQAK